MRRDLKFKIWHKTSKEWCGFIGLNQVIPRNSLEYSADELEYYQYTGLKDKNGKEIYEGDILKDFEFPVTFRDGCFFVGIAYDLTEIPLYDLDMKEVEVVGNVFKWR